MRVAILTTPFDPYRQIENFQTECGDFGATVSFVGRCRANSPKGAVRALELQHYPGFTERVIEDFVRKQLQANPGANTLVLHRIGAIEPGEPIVLVAAASAHRAAAFALVDTIMNFLKTDAPFWKRERTDAGSAWIEPTAADHARRTREVSKP